MKRIVLFVEGDGEADAIPALAKQVLNATGSWHDVLLDEEPFRVGSVHALVKSDFREWRRLLGASLKRSNVGGGLLTLDGDQK